MWACGKDEGCGKEKEEEEKRKDHGGLDHDLIISGTRTGVHYRLVRWLL